MEEDEDVWQPIHTAPFGPVLVGKWIYWGGKPHWTKEIARVWSWCDGTWPWSKKVKTFTFDGTYYTHWKPLPAPPTDNKEQTP